MRSSPKVSGARGAPSGLASLLAAWIGAEGSPRIVDVAITNSNRRRRTCDRRTKKRGQRSTA